MWRTGARAGPCARVRGMNTTTAHPVGKIDTWQGRNELEASRLVKEQAKASLAASWDELHDELPGRHKARGNDPNGNGSSRSSKQ